ncbi:MAG: CHAT domain-containing protein [Gammaproteobacteria bacterium]|nr:CHAT domain-containing protein [Gammaproteobacteria bacterium]
MAEDTIKILIEAPSGERFEAEVPRDTPLKQLAADFFNSQNWPMQDQQGKGVRAVVELANPNAPDETKRLNGNDEVGDAGILDGDTLRIFPESIAGCFLAGTQISLPNGLTKSIEKLFPGDNILSFELDSSKVTSTIVKEIYRNYTDEFLTINDTCKVTGTHPIWSNGAWKKAKEIRVEDRLTQSNGNNIQVKSISHHSCQPTKIYNLYVSSPDHCFFANGFLVHNMDSKSAWADEESLFQNYSAKLLLKSSSKQEDIDQLKELVNKIQIRLTRAEKLELRVEKLEYMFDKIARGFQAFGSTLQKIQFVPTGTSVAKQKKDVSVEIKLDRKLEEFDHSEQEKLIAEISKQTGMPCSQLKVVDIAKGSVLVTIEMPDEAAKMLMNHYLERSPFIEKFLIQKIEIRRLMGSNPETRALPKPQSDTIKILVLASNPMDRERLRLDEEVRQIDDSLLQRAEFRDRFKVEQQWAVSISDLQGHLLRFSPHIVHFSGHGSESSELLLEDSNGNGRAVPRDLLSELFLVLKDNVRCVVLNLCYSAPQADAIAEHIDCVVGMSQAIGDNAAIPFAKAFYQALGYGRSVAEAFALGKLQVDIEGLNDTDIPQLIAKRANPASIRFV